MELYAKNGKLSELLEGNKRILVLSPHQDDESLGLATFLQRMQGDKYIVYLTNGAPHKGYPIQKNKMFPPFSNPDEYAAVRKKEALKATRILEIPCANITFWDSVDSCLALDLEQRFDDLKGLINRINPDIILSPPYEGAHPDHDACAVLAKTINRTCAGKVKCYEYALYNQVGGIPRFNDFMTDSDSEEYAIMASPEELRLKNLIIDCYISQKGDIVDRFPRDIERIRPAEFWTINGQKPASLSFAEKYFGFKPEEINEAYERMRSFLKRQKLEELIKKGDKLMYKVKKTGRIK